MPDLVCPTNCPMCGNILFLDEEGVMSCTNLVLTFNDNKKYSHYRFWPYHEYSVYEQFVFETHTIDRDDANTYICDLFFDGKISPPVRLNFFLEFNKFDTEEKVRKLLCLI